LTLSGKGRRDKGTRFELEVRDAFRAYGFDCDRVPNSGGLRIKGDLYGNLPVHVEAKHHERWSLKEWLRQARADAPSEAIPVVIFRENRGETYATLPLDNLLVLLKVEREYMELIEKGKKNG
jgi:hypothetical protein